MTDTPRQHEIDEPFLESAPLARRWAAESCLTHHATGTSCQLYHGLWQYQRLLKPSLGLPEDTAQIVARLQQAARSGSSRVLISGAADFGILSRVLYAFRDVGLEPHVTVTDRCETPLRLNRWYAERHGTSVETKACDILTFQSAAPFDVVVSHGFVRRFKRTERRDLLSLWHGLLRPGGMAIGADRVFSGATEDVAFDRAARSLDDLMKAMREKAATLGDKLTPSFDTLLPELKAYNQREEHEFAMASADDLHADFIDAGFANVDLALILKDQDPLRTAPAGFTGTQRGHVHFTAHRGS